MSTVLYLMLENVSKLLSHYVYLTFFKKYAKIVHGGNMTVISMFFTASLGIAFLLFCFAMLSMLQLRSKSRILIEKMVSK